MIFLGKVSNDFLGEVCYFFFLGRLNKDFLLRVLICFSQTLSLFSWRGFRNDLLGEVCFYFSCVRLSCFPFCPHGNGRGVAS